MRSDSFILLATQKNASDDAPATEAIYEIGTLASVLQLLKLPDGTVKVLVEGAQRAQVVKYTDCSEITEAEAVALGDTMGERVPGWTLLTEGVQHWSFVGFTGLGFAKASSSWSFQVLITGKITGNFVDSGFFWQFWRPVSERIQWLADKFPTQTEQGNFCSNNREFSSKNREFPVEGHELRLQHGDLVTKCTNEVLFGPLAHVGSAERVHHPVIAFSMSDERTDAHNGVVDVLRELVAENHADLLISLTDEVVGVRKAAQVGHGLRVPDDDATIHGSNMAQCGCAEK
jgi:hypothetical protein